MPTAELAVLANNGMEVMEKASPPLATEQTDRHILLAICTSRGLYINHLMDLQKRECDRILYLSVDFLSAEADVVILIVQLTSSDAGDVLPIKRIDRTRS